MSSSLDSAKNAVKSFLSKDGKHDTTVHENVAPAVTEETVNQHRHENVIRATDREVHQDHYHTTVQPVHDTKTLPEQHHYNAAPVEHRKFEHGNDDEVQRRLQTERAQFKDTTVHGETKHTQAAGAHLQGEHIHHHVHENIQPVVQRQTIEPHVVHTTVPVHEVHHSAAQHHSSTALPSISMNEFKKAGGVLEGGKQHTEFFDGEPRSGAGHVPHSGDASNQFRNTGHHDQHAGGTDSHTTGHTGGVTGAAAGAATGGHTGSHSNTSGVTGTTGHSSHTGTTGHTGTDGAIGQGHTGTTTDNTTSGTGHSAAKPSLLDRVNPFKDSDHDGKRGVMD